MYAVPLAADADEAGFREAARRCLALEIAPSDVAFVADDAPSLFATLPDAPGAPEVPVPRAFLALMADVLPHRGEDRFALLYALLWRLTHGEKRLLERASDPVVARLAAYGKAVRRDIHKMHAFLRFREREIDGRACFTAWFEPQHRVLRRATSFFVDRFTSMDWLIATPDGSAAWIDRRLTFGPGGAPPGDAADAVLDDIWLAYYRTIFNPARLMVDAMKAEMPKHYWKNMPEARLIPGLIRAAPGRVSGMAETSPAPPPGFAEKVAARRTRETPAAPDEGSLDGVRERAKTCTRCPLYRNATQVVFGEGPEDTEVVFVGEQPGDREDIEGRPFVGPAGGVLDRALRDAGIARERIYLTNAVKHFKFEPRGKRRLHKRPDAGEIEACRWWLEKELGLVKPSLVVALGATAARALAGKVVPVGKSRGRVREIAGRSMLVTVHPSYLLRVPDKAQAAREYDRFVADLEIVAAHAPSVKAAA